MANFQERILAPLSGIGGAVERGLAYLGGLTQLLGRALADAFTSPLKRSLGLQRACHQAMVIGVGAIPVVSFITFFIGIIMALQGAYELKRFGAIQFVADTVAITITRELGPLVTAIVVIGRSGSAFAAEIGTMKVTEELDALETMALRPVGFLVTPKLLAMLVMMPCLTIWADFMGVFGGCIFGVIGADFTFSSYFAATRDALFMRDILTGLVKSLVFALVITGVGCQEGFSTGAGSEEVGRSTTAAVVTSIFLVVVVDLVFTAIFYVTGGGVVSTSSEAVAPIISAKDLRVQYGTREILHGINFDVNPTETIVILGGSGSGKSTLLRTLVGLEKPTSGSVWVRGTNLAEATPAELDEVRKKIGLSFQGGALIGSMTVGENVALPLREHTDLNASTIDVMVQIKLQQVGLSKFQHFMPSQLSGGMKKRAALARSTAMDPEILFFDEPSAGLDPITAAGIDALILNLKKALAVTIVVVTHEMASAFLIADRVIVLDGGHIAAIGPIEELKQSTHPRIQQLMNRVPDSDEADDMDYLQLFR